jgi:hypothetical protein
VWLLELPCYCVVDCDVVDQLMSVLQCVVVVTFSFVVVVKPQYY